MADEWTITIDGESISALDEKDRYATIVGNPSYRKDNDAPNAEKQRVKLIVPIQLPDGRKADYYMNRTSARFVATRLKTDLSDEAMKSWVGYRIVWGKILTQMVAGQEKKVLYVTEVVKTEDVVTTEKV